jgi:HEPN domain-containing protein
MQPDEPKVAATRGWLDLARQDLAGAEHLADVARLPALAVYHWQQAAEKSLNAVLTWNDRPLRRIHDLLELVAQCEQVDSAFVVLRTPADRLTPYASEFRYPSAALEPSPDQVEEARQLSGQIVHFVTCRLPPRTHA